MINYDWESGIIGMTCDNDVCTYSQEFEGSGGQCDLYGAVDEARECGWKIFKEDGEWVHVCPSCER